MSTTTDTLTRMVKFESRNLTKAKFKIEIAFFSDLNAINAFGGFRGLDANHNGRVDFDGIFLTILCYFFIFTCC